MTTNPGYERDAARRLMAEAQAQRSRELREAAQQALDAFRWKGLAVMGGVCLAVAGVAGCAG